MRLKKKLTRMQSYTHRDTHVEYIAREQDSWGGKEKQKWRPPSSGRKKSSALYIEAEKGGEGGGGAGKGVCNANERKCSVYDGRRH